MINTILIQRFYIMINCLELLTKHDIEINNARYIKSKKINVHNLSEISKLMMHDILEISKLIMHDI